MSTFIAIRAVAQPQQIIPNREVVAQEEIARQLAILNENGLRIRTDRPIEAKIVDKIQADVKLPGLGTVDIRIKDPIQLK